MIFGAAHVKGGFTVPSGSGTQFTDGAARTLDLGLQVLKVYATPDYLTDYPLQSAWSGTPTNLTQLVSLTQYTTAFAAFNHIGITVFTFANGTTNWWRANPSNTKLKAEYDEIYALVVHLLTTYDGTGKHFVLQNWEGDWAFQDSFTHDVYTARKMTDYYAAFLNVRQRAVTDARKATAHSNVSVRMAVEVNRIIDAPLAHRARIITRLAGKIHPDLISYSAYDGSIDNEDVWSTGTAGWAAVTTVRLPNALRAINRAFPGIPIQIGEFGYPENEAPPENDVAEMIQVTAELCEAYGVERFIYWQIFANDVGTPPDDWRGFWLYNDDGDVTVSGAKMAELAAA